MNDQERDHIKQVKIHLIKDTKITPTLLAWLPNVFSDYDIQLLEKTGELKPDIKTASTFYDLAITKKGLFNPLIKALDLDSQKGVADWLRKLPEDQRQQSETNNAIQVNRMPEPQASGNQPHASHQNQSAVPIASIAPLSECATHGTGSGDMKELVETLGISETEVQKLLDFVKDDASLEVIVEKPDKKIDDSLINWDDSYNLPPESKGIKGFALFLNIIDFENPCLGSRKDGADLDMEYMMELWTQLGYKIHPVSKKDREKRLKYKIDVIRMIEDFKEACAKANPKSIVVFIGSHGGWDRICTSDPADADGTPVTLKLYGDIIEQFSTDNCPSLENKPKIFLIQTCQDHIRNQTDTVPSLHLGDTIVCTAQVPGFEANRDIYKGSWFVYCLTWVFMKKAHKCTLREMLDMVKLIIKNIRGTATTGQMAPINDIGMSSKLRFYLDP